MNQLPPFLKKRLDGRYDDTRLTLKPKTRVRITGGQNEGQEAVIDTLIGMVQEDGNWIAEPGYSARLDDEHWITIRWDLVVALE